VQQGDGLFDDPPVATEAGAVWGTAAGDDRPDALGPDPAAVAVVTAVGVEPVESSAGTANLAAYRRDLIDQGQ
jgi:hypothetical protein